MASATVNTNGQVTIPREVRMKLGLRPGSRISFEPTASGGFEISVQSSSIRDLKGAVPRRSRSVSLKDMDAAITAGAAGQPK